MAKQIILEFSGVDAQQYHEVNAKLGIDPNGADNWPDGLQYHSAGVGDDGTFVVSEIWASQEDQAAFMEGRLGAALGEVQVPPPVRVTWLDVVAEQRF